jgi:glycosyltransferase involved in cell wall biosynthesis
MKLSATVIAQDEEGALPGCLASLRGFCDEIVVVDGGSRDKTREVASAAGARLLERPFDDYARQHEFARAEARGEWVLSIDADERASPELWRELGVLGDPFDGELSAYSLPFKNHFRGVWLRHGGFWPDRHVPRGVPIRPVAAGAREADRRRPRRRAGCARAPLHVRLARPLPRQDGAVRRAGRARVA